MLQQFKSKVNRVAIMGTSALAVMAPMAFAVDSPSEATTMITEVGTKLATELTAITLAAVGAFMGYFALKVALKGGINFLSTLFSRRS